MVLEPRHTGVLGFFLDPLASRFRHVDPNVITWLSLPFAVLAAVLVVASDPATEAGNYYLVLAAAAVGIMGILDLLDGRVARLANRASPYGDFLDHSMDRFIDTILIVAVAFSAWAHPGVGLVALAGTLLTSYMGTQAQAVGASRVYGGFLARADRVILLIAAPLVDHFFAVYAYSTGWGYGADHALGLALWFMAIVGVLTSVQRFAMILISLRRK